MADAVHQLDGRMGDWGGDGDGDGDGDGTPDWDATTYWVMEIVMVMAGDAGWVWR